MCRGLPLSPGRLHDICPIRCTSTRLLLLPLCQHRIDPITIGSGQRSITAQRLSNSCQRRYVTVRYAHDRRARKARNNPHSSHYQNLSKRLFRYCFFLCAGFKPALLYCWQHQPHAVWLVEAIAVMRDAARYTAATTAQRARERARDIRA